MTTKLRLDKELGVIEKIVPTAVPKIIPNTIEVSDCLLYTSDAADE